MCSDTTVRGRTRAEREPAETSSRDQDIILELDTVSKFYSNECAIDDLTLSVRRGELLTILGPSGCGKTTALRLIAGLERPDGGEIRLDGAVVADHDSIVPPEERDVGIVFQDFALFPHLTVAENIGFGLQELSEPERSKRVDSMLRLVNLETHADHYPDELSGGQRQRVALARSLAPEPAVLLLDEPFSNLDVDLRVEMREEVRSILKEAGVTGISVTHDQEEAMSISDRVAVMNAGRIEQVGGPEDVFQRPQSRFVAGFLGHASFIPGYISGGIIETPLGPIRREQIFGLAPEYDHMRIDVLVRPDDITVRPAESTDDANGRVTYRRYLGPTVLYRIELERGGVVEAMHNHAQNVSLDSPVSVDLSATHDLAWFPAVDKDGPE